mmetsp:Transcript_18963/g.46583  ORF Transcript_18963/g.46583 Transcript_18963/m.46583 type:complete len:244 (+) Transcript_18963:164-895(+)
MIGVTALTISLGRLEVCGFLELLEDDINVHKANMHHLLLVASILRTTCPTRPRAGSRARALKLERASRLQGHSHAQNGLLHLQARRNRSNQPQPLVPLNAQELADLGAHRHDVLLGEKRQGSRLVFLFDAHRRRRATDLLRLPDVLRRRRPCAADSGWRRGGIVVLGGEEEVWCAFLARSTEHRAVWHSDCGQFLVRTHPPEPLLALARGRMEHSLGPDLPQGQAQPPLGPDAVRIGDSEAPS